MPGKNKHVKPLMALLPVELKTLLQKFFLDFFWMQQKNNYIFAAQTKIKTANAQAEFTYRNSERI